MTNAIYSIFLVARSFHSFFFFRFKNIFSTVKILGLSYSQFFLLLLLLFLVLCMCFCLMFLCQCILLVGWCVCVCVSVFGIVSILNSIRFKSKIEFVKNKQFTNVNILYLPSFYVAINFFCLRLICDFHLHLLLVILEFQFE